MDVAVDDEKEPSDLLPNDETPLDTQANENPPEDTATKTVQVFSDEDRHLIEIQAEAYEIALERHERKRIAHEVELAEQARANEVPVEPPEPYHERYFFTKIFSLLFVPACVFLLVSLVSFLVQAALVQARSTQTEKALLVEVVVLLITGWWIAIQWAKAFKSSLQVDEVNFNLIEPRILWLGLLGSKSAFPIVEISVTNYYESFWNFIPGWNSWVLEMDTAAQNDKKIQRVKYVKDGDRVVGLIAPHVHQSKKKLFRRR